jgi:hypothetical protein
MSKLGALLGVAAVAGVLMASGCNQAADQTAAPAAAGNPAAEVMFDAFRGATINVADAVVTVQRGADGASGVEIRRSAALVQFSVQGAEDARVRITQGERDRTIRARRNNSVMSGPGGATNVRVYSPSGANLTVTVTGVQSCQTTACTPPEFPAEEAGTP